nr:hypothetical protein Itr_chr01CG10030 [Ipomoea trifida]
MAWLRWCRTMPGMGKNDVAASSPGENAIAEPCRWSRMPVTSAIAALPSRKEEQGGGERSDGRGKDAAVVLPNHSESNAATTYVAC